MPELVIAEGSADDVAALVASIPELDALDRAEYETRMHGCGYCLVATLGDTPAGFKVGYDRYRDGSFYSWLGGVVPVARREGVAQALLEAQEAWARHRGFSRIYVKTRNKFVGMRNLLARNGYQIVRVERQPDEDVGETGLMHFKAL